MYVVIDDERTFADFPDEDTVYFRTSQDAIDFLKAVNWDDVREIWLDHDLGGDDTAMRVVDFLVEHYFYACEVYNWDGKIYVHSMNPVGANNIVRALERYYAVARTTLPVCV